jgi:hypothetical protein
LIILIFLLPLAIYSFILATLNRGKRSVLVSGPWDMAGVLFGVSGFLIVGGPAALSSMYDQWRLFWLIGSYHRLREIRADWYGWLLLFAAYFIFMLTLSAWLIVQARFRTSVYNVDTGRFEQFLFRALDRIGCTWTPMRARNIILGSVSSESAGDERADSASVAASAASATQASPLAVQAFAAPILQWRPFEWGYHVALIWQGVDDDLRRQIEDGLAEELRCAIPLANPFGKFFLTFTVLSSLPIFLTAGALVALRYLR